MAEFKLHTQTEYAKLKRVSKQYIAKLVKLEKLKTYLCPIAGKYLIIDCDSNNKRFKEK
jgi:hypothetical protein